MNNVNSALITDIFELNRRLSENLWQMANEQGRPSNLSPHVIYPLKRDQTVRISEQEARVLCCGLLNNLSLYYSVETPTEQRYVQKGKRKEGMSAQTDLTIYVYDGQSLNRAINVEFKGPQASQDDVGKDIEKLVREGYQGNWFHILRNYNAGTFPALFSKFKYAFTEYPKLYSPEKLSSKTISILFCFCVLARRQSYMRHFLYEPATVEYDNYVSSFFDPTRLRECWKLFSKQVISKKKETNQRPSKKIKLETHIEHRRPKWERISDSDECFDLSAINWKELNMDILRELLHRVETAETPMISFDKTASSKFNEWFDAPDQTLSEFAYATLNNWAFGEGTSSKDTDRALAALDFWNALFCVRPHERLTNPKVRGGKRVLPERFELWWPKQQERQRADI